jgi:hypothetical protein
VYFVSFVEIPFPNISSSLFHRNGKMPTNARPNNTSTTPPPTPTIGHAPLARKVVLALVPSHCAL